MEHLSSYLLRERDRYIYQRKEEGGTAEGFREHVRDLAVQEPTKFKAWLMDALMEATTKAWQCQPRKSGEDLFSINGITIPEHLTRPSLDYLEGVEDAEDEGNKFEKVSSAFATVNDLREHAIIHMRIAAQTAAAAEGLMKAADAALKRAKGNLQARLMEMGDGWTS
jgi:hypothetical protein